MGIVLQLGWSPRKVRVCNTCVCVCVRREHLATMTTQVGRLENGAQAWLLLGRLGEFSSGMPPKPGAPPLLWPQEATWGEDHGKEEELVPLVFHSQLKMELCTTYNKEPHDFIHLLLLLLLWEAQDLE